MRGEWSLGLRGGKAAEEWRIEKGWRILLDGECGGRRGRSRCCRLGLKRFRREKKDRRWCWREESRKPWLI